MVGRSVSGREWSGVTMRFWMSFASFDPIVGLETMLLATIRWQRQIMLHSHPHRFPKS
jgi:hypothetical protein